MGYSISWLAVKGRDPQAFLENLGYKSTGEAVNHLKSPASACDLKNGWYLVFLKGYGHQLVSDESLKSLSTGSEILSVSLEEHVMCVFASLWQNGQQQWKITHDAQEGCDNLVVEGNPPPFYSALSEVFLAKQAEAERQNEGVDYLFDVPILVAKALTSYQHDEKNSLVFEVLSKKNSSKGGFFRRLFS